jgi:hypothetical protein
MKVVNVKVILTIYTHAVGVYPEQTNRMNDGGYTHTLHWHTTSEC